MIYYEFGHDTVIVKIFLMVKDSNISKTCISCGLEKQLAAFLQINGPEGSSYGNVCSTCRGSGLGKVIVIPEQDDERHSSSSTGLKIDAKSKIHIDIEKKQTVKNKQELDIEEKKKDELTTDKLLEKKEQKQDAETKHRQQYIDPKKRDSFLNYQSKKPPTSPFIAARDHEAALQKTALDQHGTLETLHKETATKQEEQLKSIDILNIDTDLTQPKLKLQSAEFIKAVKAQGWLRTGAQHNPGIERQFLAKNPASQQNSAKTTQTEKNADPLLDAIDEIFEPNSPGSGRRR